RRPSRARGARPDRRPASRLGPPRAQRLHAPGRLQVDLVRLPPPTGLVTRRLVHRQIRPEIDVVAAVAFLVLGLGGRRRLVAQLRDDACKRLRFRAAFLQQLLVLVHQRRQPAAELSFLASRLQRPRRVLGHLPPGPPQHVFRLQARLGQNGLRLLFRHGLRVFGHLLGERQRGVDLRFRLRNLVDARLQALLFFQYLLVLLVQGLVRVDHLLDELVHVLRVVSAPRRPEFHLGQVSRLENAHASPSAPGLPPAFRNTATASRPLRVGPPTSCTTASPRPAKPLTSPAFTVCAGSVFTRPLSVTRSAFTSRAMRVRDNPKARLPTASSRGDATVPFTSRSRTA